MTDPAALDTHEHSDLPALIRLGDSPAPTTASELSDFDIEEQLILDCALKLASTVPHFNTEWAGQQLGLPLQIMDEICWKLKEDQLLEVLGQLGPFRYRYNATGRGREVAARLLEISGYVGRLPVALASYNSMIVWQSERLPKISLPNVEAALADLVLPDQAVEVAALAAASDRSLFLFGPAGNGKTSIGRALNDVAYGEFWIPHSIAIDAHIIRVYDPQHHEVVDVPEEDRSQVDQRWVRVRRPFVVAGGEMTLDEVELNWSSSLRFYEAPLQVKANGGVFFIDDLGRQHVPPEDLLNRWIVPLENQVDYLTLLTGQKIQVPFNLMLIIATNLSVGDVADPAFLRRMGYRLHVYPPDETAFRRIFTKYAAKEGTQVSESILELVLDRYRTEGRELRASEPRDLIERAKDICKLHDQPFQLTEDIMNTAWLGYFGNM